MSLTQQSRRAAATARMLRAVYRRKAHTCLVSPIGQTILEDRLIILRVHDREEGLDGQKIEVDLRGFAGQLRRSDAPEKSEALRGALITLTDDQSFCGFTQFRVDGAVQDYGRDGSQLLLSLTAVPPNDPEADYT